MERCKTCKHWEAYKADEWGVLKGAGICHAAREIWKVTEDVQIPDSPGYHLALLPDNADTRSMVMDGSHYSAKLVTMPDFGCVQHAT